MSSGEDPKITYYSTVLAIELKNEDGNRFSSLYDSFTKHLNAGQVERLKELARVYANHPLEILRARVKWLDGCGMNEQDTVDADNKTSPPESSMSNDHPSDDAAITLSITGKAKSTPHLSPKKSSSSWVNNSELIPYMDDDSDTVHASENRYISSYGGTADFVACKKSEVATTNSGGLEESKCDSWNLMDKRFSEQDIRENYIRNRGNPVAISIGDGISCDNHQTNVCENSNDWPSLSSRNGFSQSKNSSGDESGDSRSGASTRSKENKKLRKKKRKQSRSLNGEAELNNVETESKDSKLGAGMTAAAQRNRRRKKWNENHNKTAAEEEEEKKCVASAPVLTASVGTTATERPKKKRSVKSFKEEKAREQNFSSQLTSLQYFKEVPISVNIKQENTLKKKKQEEEKRKEEIKEFFSEERMNEIIKSIEDVSGDKKKPKETKAVAPPKQKGKKNKKNKKMADQGKKNQLNENKSASSSVVGNGETEKALNTMEGEIIVGGKVESSISDNDDGDKDFVIQRRSRKTNTLKNNNSASGRTSPSALQGKRGKRRYSDPSPKTDEMQTKSPNGSNHQSSSSRGNAAVATTSSNHCGSSAVENMRAKAADLSNENNWPKLEAAFMPSTGNHDGISAVQTGSSHQSVASYASKLKANLDSIGCSPASSGEDGNSSTSSGGGLSNVNQYSNCTTSPNEFEPSSSFPNHSSNQSEPVPFAETHSKCSAASKKEFGSSPTSVVTSFSVSSSSKNREQEISWAGSSSSNHSNVGALDQSTGRSSDDFVPAVVAAKSAGSGKTINKKVCDVTTGTSPKSVGDENVKKTEEITASGTTATTETTSTRVENATVANKKSVVDAKTATADKKRENTNKSEITKSAPLKKGNENVVKEKKAPSKQQVNQLATTLPRKASTKSKTPTDEKKKATTSSMAFHDTDADVRTILENNWKFSFFYNDPSMPDPIDISACLSSKKDKEESAEKQPTVSSQPSPPASSSTTTVAVPAEDGDEKLVAVPKEANGARQELSQCENTSTTTTEKTTTSAPESSRAVPTPIVLTEPKRSQRLLNGTTVTSAWNDPGQFNVLAAQKFCLKRFKELSKTAVCYSRNHSD